MIREFTILAVAALATLAGCAGGHTIYARPGPLCDKAIEAGQIWQDATGVAIDVVCVSSANPMPDGADRIEAVPPGSLGLNGPFDVCGETDRPFLGPTVIHIDLASIERNGVPLRDDLLHEMGHWLGADHLDAGQAGIMAAVYYPDEAAERPPISCADVADVCAALGSCPSPKCGQ